MHYQPRDRAPISISVFNQTPLIWHEQGLPKWVARENASDYFGVDFGIEWATKAVDVSVGLVPEFEELTLADRGEYELRQQRTACAQLRRKFMGRSCTSRVTRHGRDSWNKYYKPRRSRWFATRRMIVLNG
ncbi:MAG: hypothetical protein R2856_33355 [Caldilineaceae bacterium]